LLSLLAAGPSAYPGLQTPCQHHTLQAVVLTAVVLTQLPQISNCKSREVAVSGSLGWQSMMLLS
jgi:hypothetical protein